MRTRDHRRLLGTGTAAGAAHVLLLLVASRLAPTPRVASLERGLSSFGRTEIDVSVDAPAPAPESLRGNELGTSSRAFALGSLRGVPRPAPELSGAGTQSVAPEAAAPEAQPGATPAPAASRPLAALGIGPSEVLLSRRDRAPEPARAAEERVERALAKGLAEHDRDLGLGSGGPILSALERATYGSDVPANASAVFLARIDSSGHIGLLDVVEATDTRWSKVAARALASVGARKLRVAAGAHGVELRIRLSSREALPSGADPGLEVRVLKIPVKKGRGKRSSRISLLEPMAKLDWVDVPTPSGESVHLPVLAVGVGLIGVSGDPSDIGATPRRVVHATVENEQPL